MPVRFFEISSALVGVWGPGSPTDDDVEETLRVARQQRARVRRPLSLICVMAPSTRMPSPEVSERMRANWPQLMELGTSMQYVNLATGFIASRLYSLIVLVFALTNHGRTLQNHNDVAKALEAAALADPGLRGHVPEMGRVITKALREVAREAERTAR